MASHNPYRFVVYALIIIMTATIIVDCIINPILWTTVFFYSLTLGLTIFRIFGRNGATIVIHIAVTVTVFIMVYSHYYDEFDVPDIEYYKEQKSLSYQLVLDKPKKILPDRVKLMAFWLTYPMGYLICASIFGIFCILNLSLNVRKMFAGLHGTLGHTVSMIYFLICVFYAQYFKTSDLSVSIKMLYYLSFLMVMLSPSLANYSQILSKHFTDEPEEEEVEDDDDEHEHVHIEHVEQGKGKKKEKREKKEEKKEDEEEEVKNKKEKKPKK